MATWCLQHFAFGKSQHQLEKKNSQYYGARFQNSVTTFAGPRKVKTSDCEYKFIANKKGEETVDLKHG